MKLSLVIEAVDKASTRIKRITGNVRDLGTRGMGVVQRATQAANRELGRFGSGIPGRLKAMTISATRFAGRMGLKAIEKSAYGAGYAIGWLVRKGAGLALATAKWAAASATFAAGWGVGNIIRTASQFEQFQVILENTEGSADKARKAMGWVKNFAKDTPYEVGEVMDAFVQMKLRGFDPMSGSLRAIGDAASGLGEPLADAVDAVASAVAGEYEPLRRFGIRISKDGNQLALTYRKNSKDISRSIKDNVVDIERAVAAIFGDKFAGMMNRQSRTLKGMWSNIIDMVSSFELDVANAGFFDVVKGKVQQLLAWVNKLSADGTLAKWAEKVSGWLTDMTNKVADFIQKTDWKAVGADLKSIASSVWWMAKNFAWAVEKARDLYGVISMINPLTGGLMGWAYRNGGSGGNSAPVSPTSRPTPGRGARAPAQKSLPNSPLKPGHQPIVWPEAYRSGRSASARPVPVGGRVEIELKGAGARDARVRSVHTANNNVPISVSANRGRVMETFA